MRTALPKCKSANAETFRSQKEGNLPPGTRCDSWWSSLGFYQRAGLPCLTTQVMARVTWFEGRGKVHISTWPSSALSFAASGGKSSRRQAVHSFSIHPCRRNRKGGMVRWPAVLCGREHLFQLSMSALCKVSGVPVHTPQYPTYVNMDQLNAQKCYMIGTAYPTQRLIAGCSIQPTNQTLGSLSTLAAALGSDFKTQNLLYLFLQLGIRIIFKSHSG